MSNALKTGLLALMLLLLVGCGADKQPIAVVIPSNTPTPPTIVPTATLTPTRAISPTASPSPVTATLRPTLAPGVEPTSPFGPTYTLAPATQTATYQATLIGLEVNYFTTNVERVTPGDSVTLFWQTSGAETVTIYRLDSAGERDRFWVVNGEGRLTVNTDPAVAGDAAFVLVAETSTNAVEETLSISGDCTLSWSFQPAPEGCPGAEPQPSFQVEQRFERGVMLWLDAGRQIYVIYGDGEQPAWEVFVDSFQEGEPERDDSLQVPAERLQPVRGFGKIWRENDRVRNRLGWAVNAEIGYDGVIQVTDDGEHLYLRTIDGVILDLQSGGESWEIVPETNIPEAAPTLDATSEAPTSAP